MHDVICQVGLTMEWYERTEGKGACAPEHSSNASPTYDASDLVIADNDDHDVKSGSEDMEEGEVSESPSYDNSFGSSNDENESQASPFEEIKENIYLVDRKKSRTSKEARRMKCDCVFEPEDPLFIGCGESCLNRLLMIECTSRCRCGEFCTNKNFQRGTKFKLEVFKTEKKGFGLRTLEHIPKGSFVIEYCGEIVDYSEFMNRTELYEAEGRKHYYFMTLKTNEVIDATKKGAISRFINHSCDPNCETQKWTVYGFLRIGFFSIKDINAGEELCFDYQFERYGEKAQKCYCGATNCRGIIGGEKQARLKASFYDRGKAPLKKKERRKKEEDDEALDEALDSELSDLLGQQGEIADPEQVLELTRLMVKVERFPQRLRLLKVLQGCSDSFALKSFVRYNGLSLLWSWMVDATNESTEYKIEIMNTLQHVPIPNMNQLKDSKIFQVVQKWAKANGPVDLGKASPDGEEEGSSNSDQENDAKNGSDSSSQNGETADDTGLDNEESPEETGSKDSDDTKDEDSKDATDKREDRKKANTVASFACDLLENWKSLKEIFKIPKKSQMTPDKKSKVGSDGESSMSPADEKRYNKKKGEAKEEKSSTKVPPLMSPSEPNFSSDTSVMGGMSPVLPFLSPVRGAQSKALASNQGVSSKSTEEHDNSRSGDGVENGGRNNQGLSHEGEDANFTKLWDDLFCRQDTNSSDVGNPQLGVDEGDVGSDLIEGNYNKHWSRWSTDNDNRRAGRFGGNKNFRKKRRRGSYGWEQDRYQYPCKPGRSVGRNRTGHPEGDEIYDQGEYGNDYSSGYANEGRNDYDDDRTIRGGQSRLKDDYSVRSSPADKYRGPFHKRGYSDNRSSVGNYNIRINNRGPRPTGHKEVPGSNRLQVSVANQMTDIRPIEVINQPRSGWHAMPSGISTSSANRLPPPQIQPPFQSQPPPPRQNFAQVPSTVVSSLPRGPLLQHPVPPPPTQIPPPTNPPLGTFARYVSGAATPSVSTTPIIPLPPSNRPPLQECPSQPPPPRHPPFPIQPPLRFLNSLGGAQQLPLSPAQIPNPARLTLPAPPPSLLAARLPAPTPLPMGQLPSAMSLQQPGGESMLSPNAPLSQSQTMPAPLDINKHLQALAQINKGGLQAPMEISNSNFTSPPLVQCSTSVSANTQYLSPINDPQSESSPVSSKPIPPLPQNWKTATDPEGKIYYYHTVTRQTQWDPPILNEDDSGSLDLEDKDHANISGPRTPSLSPPRSITPSDRAGSIMAAADTTVNRHKPASAHLSQRTSAEQLSPKSQKARDAFKTKLSAVVVNCLNPYQKVDCKQGKITKTEDFKFLARKLTHGLMVKEMARVKSEGALECNDSVKIKVKEYIRNYMKKFGDVYMRS